MRRSMPLFIALALAILFAPSSHADEAQKIIDQYLKAAGGSKAVSHLQTLAVDGSLLATGEEVPAPAEEMDKTA